MQYFDVLRIFFVAVDNFFAYRMHNICTPYNVDYQHVAPSCAGRHAKFAASVY